MILDAVKRGASAAAERFRVREASALLDMLLAGVGGGVLGSVGKGFVHGLSPKALPALEGAGTALAKAPVAIGKKLMGVPSSPAEALAKQLSRAEPMMPPPGKPRIV